MPLLTNRAKMTITSVAGGGTGDLTLNAADTGFQTFASSGVSDGNPVRYVIEEGSDFEIGVGVYTSSGTTLSRVPTESSNSGSAITVTSAGTVFIGATQDDFAKATALSLVFGR